MDSELSQAMFNIINFPDDIPNALVNDLATVMDAARKVANLDIEAATAVTYELRYIKDDDEWDDKIEDITRRAVATALGITEDTDG